MEELLEGIIKDYIENQTNRGKFGLSELLSTFLLVFSDLGTVYTYKELFSLLSLPPTVLLNVIFYIAAVLALAL